MRSSDDPVVNDLLQRLYNVRLAEDKLINELVDHLESRRQSHQEPQSDHGPNGNNKPDVGVPSASPNGSTHKSSKKSRKDKKKQFHPPQTIYIDNELGSGHRKKIKASGRDVTKADRSGVITGYNALLDRVDIQTFNGYDTWRLSKNLRIISAAEAEEYRRLRHGR